MTRGRVLAFLALLVCALIVSCGGSGKKAAVGNVVSLDEIHPCDTNDPFGIIASRLNATPTPSPRPTNTAVPPTARPGGGGGSVTDTSVGGTTSDGCTGPDFSQRCALWGNDEYDHANGQDVGCGKTIAQCGCAMTAAASMLVRYGVTKSPDGLPTNPKTLNDWMKQDARSSASGTVSRGYLYGMVIWGSIATYSAQASAKFGTPAITFYGMLAGGDLVGLQREIGNKRPVILEQKGHYILATGEAPPSSVSINDPFYPDRAKLDTPQYKNTFLSGRLYRPGSDVSAIMVGAPKGVTFAVKETATGQTVGLKPAQPAQPAQPQTPITEVRQSMFVREQAYRDPTCTVTSPRLDQG